MKAEKSITRVLAWQTAGNFILQGIGFITAPVFTRLLTPSDYGQTAVYSAWVSLCSLFVGLQTYSSIENAKIKYDREEIDSYLSSIMTISVTSFIIFLGIAVTANGFLSNLLRLRSDLVVLLVVHSFTSFCVQFHTRKLLQYKQTEWSTLISLSVSIVSTGLSIGFLYFTANNRYIVKIYTNALPIIITGFIIVLYVYIKGRCLFDRKYWKYCLLLTLPLILHGAGGLILSQSDRVMLQRIVGENSVGIYSFAYTVSSVISVIWNSIRMVWVPFYYEYKKNNQHEIILLRTRNLTVVYSILTIGFLLLVPEVYKLMSPEKYWQGIQLMPLIVAAYYFNFLYNFPANFEFYREKTRLISIGTLCAAAINVICNFLLIPVYAGMGAAIATLIAYIFCFVFHEIIARFVIKEYENKFSTYFIGVIPVGISIVLFYALQELWLIRWGIGFILGIYLLHRVIKSKAVF